MCVSDFNNKRRKFRFSNSDATALCAGIYFHVLFSLNESVIIIPFFPQKILMVSAFIDSNTLKKKEKNCDKALL